MAREASLRCCIENGIPMMVMANITANTRCRSAISIPSNVAEGAGRNGKGEFKQFLAIANGSAYELQTQVEISKR